MFLCHEEIYISVHDRQATRVLRAAVSQPTDWATMFRVKETQPAARRKERERI